MFGSHNTTPLSRWSKRVAALVLLVVIIGVLALYRPTSIESLKAEARTAWKRRDPDRVLQLTDKILTRNPDDHETLVLAAEANEQRMNHELALSFFDRAAQTAVDSGAQASYRAGRILMYRLFRPGEAEKRFRAALEFDPNHSDALSDLALLLAVESRQYEAVPLVLKLFANEQVNMDLLVLLGWENGAVSRPELLEGFRKYSPDDPAVQLANAWHVRNSRTDPDPEKALQILHRVVQRNPDFVPARFALVELAWQQKRHSLVIEHLSECFHQRDVPPEVWIVRGEIAAQSGDHRGAARCFWEALRVNPADRSAVYKLSQSAEKLNRESDAERLDQLSVTLQRLRTHRDFVLTSEHASLDPLFQLVGQLEAAGRLWEAWGWCRIAGGIDRQSQWPSEKEAALQPALMNCGSRLVCSEIANDVNFSNEPLPDWKILKTLPEPSDLSLVKLPAMSFRDDADSTGIRFQYFNSPHTPGEGQHMYEFSGGGVGVLDFDGDGWPDVYYTQGCQWPVDENVRTHTDRLFRNARHDGFIDVTETSGLVETRFTAGIAVGDFDSDGFDDIYVGNIGANRLCRNLGDGTFEDVTVPSGAGDFRWTTSCVIADFNGDALPDIYSVNYLEGNDVFERICRHDDGRPRMCMPFHFPASQNQMYLNLGDGQFQNITMEAGLTERDGKGLGVVAADLNGDGRMDVFVANDTVNNSLFVNVSTGIAPLAFEEQGLTRGLAFNGEGKAEGSMGVAAGDADGDGRLDLFVTNFHQETNTLYSQNVPGRFTDRTQESGLAQPGLAMLGFGTQFIDVDLNGNLDLLVTNGHIDDLTYYGRPYHMPTQVFCNRGDGQFVEVPPAIAGEFFHRKSLGRGMATLDWNRDGRMDVAVSFLESPAALLTNTSSDCGRSLRLRLRGTESSRNAIGAVVELTTESGSFVQQLTAGSGYQASNEQLLIFGLGNTEAANAVTIRWPSGRELKLRGLNADHEWLIRENDDIAWQLPP